jgi:hypothetical protein
MDNPLDGLQQVASDVSSDIQQAAQMLANAIEDLGLAGLEYVLQSLGIHDQHMMDKLKQAIHQLGASPGVVRDVVWNIYTQGEHFLTQEVQKLIDPIHYSMNQFNAQLVPDQDFHTSQTQSRLAILTNLRGSRNDGNGQLTMSIVYEFSAMEGSSLPLCLIPIRL